MISMRTATEVRPRDRDADLQSPDVCALRHVRGSKYEVMLF
jgi:hypothetical protein